MAKLIFDVDAVRVLFEHSKSAKEHNPTFGMLCTTEYLKEGEKLEGAYAKTEQIDFSKIPAHLVLVKDSGAYLMSGARNRLAGEKTHNKVVYANGYGPDADWDKVQDALGGDDFAEALTLDMFEQAMASKATKLWINVSQSRLSVGWTPGIPALPRQARVRPEYDRRELTRISAEAGAVTRPQWASAGKTYKGVVVAVTDLLVYQKVRRGIVVHERALTPEPVPRVGSTVALTYPIDVNGVAKLDAKGNGALGRDEAGG